MTLPERYAFLQDEPGPRLLIEFLKVYGVTENTGPGSNPTILGWAKKIGLEKIYRNDATAWCGLAMAYVAGQAGWDNAPLGNALWARNWTAWGQEVKVPMLADVLVFERGSAGHVGIYVGEDSGNFHVLGGNQSDRVSIAPKPKSRLLAARRCPWRINQPANVRRILLRPNTAPSGRET